MKHLILSFLIFALLFSGCSSSSNILKSDTSPLSSAQSSSSSEKEKISSSSYKEANKLTHFGIIECDNNYFYYAYHNQLLKVKKSLDSDPILLFKSDESDIKNICIHEDYIYFTAPTLQRIDKGGNNFCELTIEYDSDALSAANSIRQSKHLTEITSTQILEPHRIICTGDYLYVFSTENFLSRKSWLENSLTIDLSRIDSSSPSGWIYDIKNDPTSVKPISNVSNLANQSSYPLIAIIGAPFGNYEYSISISDGDVNGNTIVSLVNLTENEEILKESGDPSLILEHTQYLPHSDCIFYILFYNKDPGIYMCDLNGNESKKLIETTDNMFYLLDSDETYLYYVHIIPNYSDINQRSTFDIEYHMFDYHTYTDTCFLYTTDNIDNFSSTDMSNLPVICDGTIYFPTSFENDEMSNILLYNIVSKNQLKAS